MATRRSSGWYRGRLTGVFVAGLVSVGAVSGAYAADRVVLGEYFNATW